MALFDRVFANDNSSGCVLDDLPSFEIVFEDKDEKVVCSEMLSSHQVAEFMKGLQWGNAKGKAELGSAIWSLEEVMKALMERALMVKANASPNAVWDARFGKENFNSIVSPPQYGSVLEMVKGTLSKDIRCKMRVPAADEHSAWAVSPQDLLSYFLLTVKAIAGDADSLKVLSMKRFPKPKNGAAITFSKDLEISGKYMSKTSVFMLDKNAWSRATRRFPWVGVFDANSFIWIATQSYPISLAMSGGRGYSSNPFWTMSSTNKRDYETELFPWFRTAINDMTDLDAGTKFVKQFFGKWDYHEVFVHEDRLGIGETVREKVKELRLRKFALDDGERLMKKVELNHFAGRKSRHVV